MKTPKKARRSRQTRKGAISALTALMLLAILGLVACALDIGWIAMTRTQLQAAADASSLAAGTELLPGLGYIPPPDTKKTPAEIVDAATPLAVEFAGYNRSGELAATFVDGDRDVEFGKATFDPVVRSDGSVGCGCWQKTPASENPAYYNYVAVKVLRNQAGSTAGDGPLGLFFARIFGANEKSLLASATAAILPANGFHVEEEGDTAPIAPLAFSKELWERYERAQKYYDQHPTALTSPNLDKVKDTTGPYPNEPLFGASNDKNNNMIYDGDKEFVQLFFDDYTRTDSGGVSQVFDNALEVNLYPQRLKVDSTKAAAGNFGTVNYAGNNNSTGTLKKQITNGLSADDLANYPNNEIVISSQTPVNVTGNTGISTSIKSAFDSIVGQCKAIALFSSITDAGTNSKFTLVRMVSATVVKVNINGNPQELRVQRCRIIDKNGVPDPSEGDMNPNQTMFTPLILIR